MTPLKITVLYGGENKIVSPKIHNKLRNLPDLLSTCVVVQVPHIYSYIHYFLQDYFMCLRTLLLANHVCLIYMIPSTPLFLQRYCSTSRNKIRHHWMKLKLYIYLIAQTCFPILSERDHHMMSGNRRKI